MKVILLDGMDRPGMVSGAVRDIYKNKCDDLAYFYLRDMNVEPCRSCGSCGQKTPGECIIRDDIAVMFSELAKSDVVVLLTPIRFGGFSSHLKKVVDKFMLLGLPLYKVIDGHMVHPPRYGKKRLVVIGVKEREVVGQEAAFKTLAQNNAINLNYTHQTIILSQADTDDIIKDSLEGLFESEAAS